MQRRILPILFVIAASITISACTMYQSSSPVIETSTPVGAFTFPLITPAPSCLPPCFYGIVPGITSQAEALSLLRAVPSQLDGPRLYWNTINPKTWYNFITFRDKLVYAIELMDVRGITFKDVIDLNGTPELVITGRPGGEAGWDDFILAYPSRGIAYQGGIPIPPLPQDRLTPTSNTTVGSEIYFAPKAKDQFSANDASRWLITSFASVSPWRGFGVSYSTP